MTRQPEFWEVVGRIRADDARYAPDAYAFVMEALDETVSALAHPRHVTAQELVDGFCRAARRRYGMMAGMVLERWGLQSGDDVGEIVFQLIDRGILSRREEDSREDFSGTVEFATLFEEEYFTE